MQDMLSWLHRLPCSVMTSCACSTTEALCLPLCAEHLPVPVPVQFDYLVREKIADGPLIAKWRKPGYEILCSMLAIQKGNHNFGTTSHCR